MTAPRHVVCTRCEHPLADRDARQQVGGVHARDVVNAAGVEYRIHLFHPTPGVVAAGPATDEDSWFDGCTWQRAYCRGCSRHVGWLFRSRSRVFSALIADRVVDRPVGE